MVVSSRRRGSSLVGRDTLSIKESTMFAWMSLIPRGMDAKKVQKPVKKALTFTEERLSDVRCVHPNCDRKVPNDRPNGWLCWEHDLELNPPKPTQVDDVLHRPIWDREGTDYEKHQRRLIH
jgi:hypothetical protein